MLQIAAGDLPLPYHEDVDLVLEGEAAAWTDRLLDLLCAVVSRRYTPRAAGQGNTDFQITRGLLGVSM
jgi:hypothetical protein